MPALMNHIILDKIGSVTKNVKLGHRVAISSIIPSVEGVIIAVEALDNKKVYNLLELPSGRMTTMHKGDILAVALGNRRALKGYVGEVPEQLAPKDIIHLLNLGGVAGICTSANVMEVGKPMRLRVLGAIVDKDGKAMSIKDAALFSPAKKLTSKIPLIVISGTCMNVGKTSVACEIIKHAVRHGHKISAAKLAGVASLKDTESMEDYGASEIVSFIDAGYTSTINLKTDAVAIAKGALNHLARKKPDYIVIEFGDGLMGEYGVRQVLKDPEIQKRIKAHIGCAHDPVGAIKLNEICSKIGAPLTAISGPVTDNSVGAEFVAKRIKLPGYNALTNGEDLFDYLAATCLKKRKSTRK